MFFPFGGGLNGDDYCEDYDNDPAYSAKEWAPPRCRKCGSKGGKCGFNWKLTKNGKWWLWRWDKEEWHQCGKN